MEFFIGQIVLFAGTYAPQGWMYCDGHLLSISQYQALFSILGTTYGGDGRTNFALPNINPVPHSADPGAPIQYIICIEGMYPNRP